MHHASTPVPIAMTEVFLCVNEPDVSPRSLWVPIQVLATQYISEQLAKDDATQFCPNTPYFIKFIGSSYYVTKELRLSS
jgi:hypothetical protein